MNLLIAILTGVVALLLLSAAVAPLESLGWYAGWFGESEEDTSPKADLVADAADAPIVSLHYLVYLSGIGAISPDSVPDEEVPFIAGLQESLPAAKVLSDLFPYSVTNMGLTEIGRAHV